MIFVNFILVLILTHACRIDSLASMCPSAESISFCKCCEEAEQVIISCSGVKNQSLEENAIRSNLETIADHLNRLEISPVIDRLEIKYTSVRYVTRQLFAGLAFKQIWLQDNFYLCLDHISQDAFLDSKDTLVVFKATIDVQGEATKEHDHDGSVLNRFKGFHNLEVFSFMNYNMSVVPGHYYCQYNLPKLRQIWLNVNGINKIEDNAFHKLDELNFLSLMNNQLHNITPLTFAFNAHSDVPLTILLWMNSLTDDSFENGAFSNTHRPVKLDISQNKLTSLAEGVFRDIVKDTKSYLNVEGNPLICDCRLKWLFQEDYIDRVKGLACIKQTKSIVLDQSDDLENCNDNEGNSMLSVTYSITTFMLFTLIALSIVYIGCCHAKKHFQ